MRVYIAGPMRGKPDFNFPAFHAAQAELERRGLEVFNPAARDTAQYGATMFASEAGTQEQIDAKGFNLREALHADTEFITLHADAICTLDGWEQSKGAKAEVALAEALGLPVYTLGQLMVAWNPKHSAFTWTETPYFPEYRAAQGLMPDQSEAFDARHPELAVPARFPIHTPGTDAHRNFQAGLARLPVLDSEEIRAFFAPVDCTDEGTIREIPHPEYDPGEIRSVNAVTGAEKGTKLARYDLIPAEPLRLLAEHYGRGARKYADRNWEKGYEWSKSFAALCRHLWAFWAGEDIDAETGSPHLVAVAWHALAMLEYTRTHPELDDRPKSD